jgi:hypothetical protein
VQERAYVPREQLELLRERLRVEVLVYRWARDVRRRLPPFLGDPSAAGAGAEEVRGGGRRGVARLARDLAREEVRGVLAEEVEEVREALAEVEGRGEEADGGAQLAGSVGKVAKLAGRVSIVSANVGVRTSAPRYQG